MDIRLAGTPTSSARIAPTSLDPDGHPAGSGPGGWSSGNPSPRQNQQDARGFGGIADGGRDAVPSPGDGYLTASYEQYDRSARIAAGLTVPVQTFVLDRTEGIALDVRA